MDDIPGGLSEQTPGLASLPSTRPAQFRRKAQNSTGEEVKKRLVVLFRTHHLRPPKFSFTEDS